MLESQQPNQKGEVESIETRLENLNLQIKQKEQEQASNFSTAEHVKACQRVKSILENQIESMSISKSKMHEKLVGYAKNDSELRVIAQQYK